VKLLEKLPLAEYMGLLQNCVSWIYYFLLEIGLPPMASQSFVLCLQTYNKIYIFIINPAFLLKINYYRVNFSKKTSKGRYFVIKLLKRKY